MDAHREFVNEAIAIFLLNDKKSKDKFDQVVSTLDSRGPASKFWHTLTAQVM